MQGLERRDATAGLGREELEEGQTVLESGHHVGRGRDARDQRDPQIAAAGGDTRAEAGRDDEPGARVDGLVDLVRLYDGAGADEQIGLGGDAPDRTGR